MDDLTSKITELLNDPEGMKKISDMASGLFNNSSEEPEHKEPENNSFIPDMPVDPIMMGKIMGAVSSLNNKGTNDDNTKLLLALKPHLSNERCAKVDKAISLMKIMKMMPILTESGFLNILGG